MGQMLGVDTVQNKGFKKNRSIYSHVRVLKCVYMNGIKKEIPTHRPQPSL